ncbi:LD-carboxypeptidase [Siminovitchia fortis]|uniref:S66 peptidase family protein n=1 Tax=Siminovitchia fortis TaxID=254758 RepID=UPI001F440655|nr:LD-carboxypeptidase [Siminovitchia fortis]WHY81630.1 LD-carboxypeptidase [Siminovitchia fortis]
MEIKKVKGITPNDVVGLTAPSGPASQEKLKKAIAALEEAGFRVEVGETCHIEHRGYLAGPPQNRAAELSSMFSNKEIKAIFCLRGGYGSPQILPLLDQEQIRNNPKLFVGYSDITALHLFLQQCCEIPTIHGPMAASDLIDADSFTKEGLSRLIKGNISLGRLCNPPGERMEGMIPGRASGILTGGNLTLISALMGTPYEIDTKGKILFLEEINEEPYKLDRMMTQLALGGKFSEAEGVVLGSWTGCHFDSNFNIKDLFKEILEPFGKPVLFNLRAGHCRPMVSLPLGAFVEINAGKGELVIKEGIIQ